MKENSIPKRVYFFRIEGNLLNGTVCCSDDKKDAIKWIKKNPIEKSISSAHTGYETIEAYESIVGKNKLPVQNELVEVELIFKVTRYKV